MISIIKNNKRIEATLDRFKDNILKRHNNISGLLAHNISTEENDRKLLALYREKGLTDYELHISHKAITDMPFNQQIDLSFMEKNSNFKHLTIHEGRYEIADYSVFDEYGDFYTPLVVLDKTIQLPMIAEDNIGWMTPVLFEEKTMRHCVEKTHGNVLVVGLGIGFFPFNALLRPEVEKITIIEYNADIIKLFKEFILPQFPRKEAIEIIHGNAYEYLNNDYISQFDYTFVDIWRNNEDGVLILSNCLKNLDLSQEIPIDFWIEDAILEDVKSALRVYLYHLYKGQLGKHLTHSIDDKREIENIITFDKVHRFFKTRNIKIKTNKELLELVGDKKMIRELLKSF